MKRSAKQRTPAHAELYPVTMLGQNHDIISFYSNWPVFADCNTFGIARNLLMEQDASVHERVSSVSRKVGLVRFQ
jgi:hypothetical protein